jgi:hypothetical protein
MGVGAGDALGDLLAAAWPLPALAAGHQRRCARVGEEGLATMTKERELADLISGAIKKCWISGRDPAKNTIVIRITKQDARRIIRALRRNQSE